jgi:hypothetical protein
VLDAACPYGQALAVLEPMERAELVSIDEDRGERHSGLARQFADQIRCLDALVTGNAETAYRFAIATSEPSALRPNRPYAAWLVLDMVESAVRSGPRPGGR